MIAALARRSAASVALLCCLAGLAAAGSVLPSPPISPELALLWWARHDSLVAAAALLRVGGMGICAWLLLATVLDTVALLARSGSLGELAARLTPALWRSLVLRPLTLGILALPQLAAPSLLPVAAAAETSGVEGREAGKVIVMSGPAEVPTITLSSIDPALPAPLAEAAGSHHEVRTGENLWSIAEAHLAELRGRRPAAAEVHPYWRALIEVNREALPSPEDPDLIYPGMILVLPPHG